MTHNAKRYQFLRDRFALESNNDEAEFAKLAHLNGDEFDAALDAAMLKAGFEIAQEVEPVGERSAFEAWAKREGLKIQKAESKNKGNIPRSRFGLCPATYYFDEAECAWRAWANKPTHTAHQAVNAWQPIETAPENQLVVTTWEDKDDKELRHNFDFLEDGVWQNYFNEHEHYLIAGAARGRSEDAPYTHWMPLPGAPA